MTTKSRVAPVKAAPTNGATDEPINIVIPPIEILYLTLVIEGDTPLMIHAFGEKARKQMLAGMTGAPRAKKEPKNPEAEYEAAFYRLEDGTPAMKAISFKAAAVTAATALKDKALSKVYLRQAFHVGNTGSGAELIAIEGEPRMREDIARVGMGVADLRYRPEFLEWRVRLPVRLNARALTVEQLIHLFNYAGFGVGVGEYRSERDGQNGLFHVADVIDVRRGTI